MQHRPSPSQQPRARAGQRLRVLLLGGATLAMAISVPAGLLGAPTVASAFLSIAALAGIAAILHGTLCHLRLPERDLDDRS